MTVRGIEAIKLYIPPIKTKINTNIREEKGREALLPTSNPLTMTSVERYRQEWSQLLEDLDENPERIHDQAFKGRLKDSKFRSVYWALLLRVISANCSSWAKQKDEQRKRYAKLQQDFSKNPHEIEVSNDDPLSQSTQSVWNQYFSDQDLMAVIKQDVIRTFPGVNFFRKAFIQDAMSNILFYYAREHPYLCYRQGMHEILAPILFVMYSDHQSWLHFKEIAESAIDETLSVVLDPNYLEADSFFLFSRLMSSIEPYYRVTNLFRVQDMYLPGQADKNNAIPSEIEVIGHLNSIRDNILAKEDLHLHNYLMKLDIPLHIFGIRWLRLLFGREFPLLDLLVLWDAIFADSDRFDLPSYILVAMLIHIRNKLLLSDYTSCLTYLMRYPTNVDINIILHHALHMQMPKKFDRPTNAFVYFTMSGANGNNGANNPNSSSAALMPRNNSTYKQPLADGSPSFAGINSQQQQHMRSTSFDDAAKVSKQITVHQARNAADSAVEERLKAKPELDRIVMDGYSLNSPEIMRLELKNAQTVITIARSKLQKYLAAVRENICRKNSDEMTHALDGIEELCNFLDVKFMFPLHSCSAPIDQALEANEQQRQLQMTSYTVVNANDRQYDSRLNDSKMILTPMNKANKPGSSSNLPTIADVETIGTTYERPDTGFMFNSARILGNRKEIELIPIATDEKIVESFIQHKSESLPAIDPLRKVEEESQIAKTILGQ